MEIRVNVIQHLPGQSGVSKSGNAWQKSSFVGETYEQYAKKVCFTIFNGKFPLPPIGSDVLVGIDLSSNSWIDKNGNERFSTDVLVNSIKPGSEANPKFQQPQVHDNSVMDTQPQYAQAPTAAPQTMDIPVAPSVAAAPQPAEKDDLPF